MIDSIDVAGLPKTLENNKVWIEQICIILINWNQDIFLFQKTLNILSTAREGVKCYHLDRFEGMGSEAELMIEAANRKADQEFYAGLKANTVWSMDDYHSSPLLGIVFMNDFGNTSSLIRHPQYKIRMGLDATPVTYELKPSWESF